MAKDVEYNLTASDKTGMGLRKAEENFKKSNERIKKETDKLGNGLGASLVKAVSYVSPELGKSLTKGIATASQAAAPLLAVGLGAAAPLIAGTLGAAVIGGVGIGAAGIGVALVAKGSPAVQAAGKKLGKSLMDGLTQDASVFVDPVLDGIDQIQAGFTRLRPRIQSIFKDSAGFLQPLIAGAVNGLDGILRGVQALVSKGQPVIRAFGNSFDILGNAVGNAFETISGGSEEAATSLETVAQAAGLVIEGVGYVIRGFSELINVVGYIPNKIADFEESIGALDKATVTLTPHMAEAASGAEDFGSRMAEGTGFVDVFGQQIADTGQATTLFSDQMKALSNATGSLFDSVTSAGEAVDKLKTSMDKNGKTLDSSTAKGRANREAISALARSYIAQYDAATKVNGIGPKTDAVADKNYSSFIRLATSLTGSKNRAADLARQLGVLPASKNIKVTADTNKALSRVNAIKAAIASVKGKTVAITVRQTRQGEILYGRQAPQMDGTRAAGGNVMAGHAYRVGENGAETFVPDSNGKIVPNGKNSGPQTIILEADFGYGVKQSFEFMIDESNRKTKQRVTARRA